MNYNQLAEQLDLAALKAQATNQLSHQYPLNLEEAYAIQSISLSRRYIRGEQLVGLKMGFTSKAKMEQMGVHDMIWGRLTDAMDISNGGNLRKSKHIHPRAEPEIAFLIKQPILEVLKLENVKDYVKGVAVAIEIIDSRYQNFKFSLEDVVADNCSSAAFALGEWHSVDTPIQNLDMALLVDGQAVHQGNSNAILGNPWESLIAASRLALANGEKLEEGSIVLAGAATAAVFLEEGQSVSARAEGLGEVRLSVIN